MRYLFLLALLVASCGGEGSSDDGDPCADLGADATACEEAAQYLECGPCDEDPDVDVTAYSISATTCEDDGDLLCANCLSNQSYRDECVLSAEYCAAECASARD